MPCYGKIEPSPGDQQTEYFVIPLYLDAALEDAGFNVKKTMQGLRERSFITTQKDSEGKERTKSSAWINGKCIRAYLFRVQSDHIQPLRGRKED